MSRCGRKCHVGSRCPRAGDRLRPEEIRRRRRPECVERKRSGHGPTWAKRSSREEDYRRVDRRLLRARAWMHCMFHEQARAWSASVRVMVPRGRSARVAKKTIGALIAGCCGHRAWMHCMFYEQARAWSASVRVMVPRGRSARVAKKTIGALIAGCCGHGCGCTACFMNRLVRGAQAFGSWSHVGEAFESRERPSEHCGECVSSHRFARRSPHRRSVRFAKQDPRRVPRAHPRPPAAELRLSLGAWPQHRSAVKAGVAARPGLC
jgi:hypothetical protein